MVQVDCPSCGKSFEVNPRPASWTGRFRTALRCPHCQFDFGWKPIPNGVQPNQTRVELRKSDQGTVVLIEQYDGELDNAVEFAQAWQSSWDRLPAAVTHVLDSHWAPQNGEPHVWLLDDRKEWGGNGWAATMDNGKSFFYLSSLVAELNREILETMIAHELGHAVCLAVAEENHHALSSAPDLAIKRECLVWRLIESWGFDQRGLDAYMEIEFQDDGRFVKRREVPLAIPQSQTDAFKKRQEYEARLQGFQIPEVIKPFIRS